MARPRRIDPLIVKRAHMTAATSTSVESLRQCQAVLLPALFGATLEQTAHALGVAVRPWLDSGRLPQARVGVATRRSQLGRATAIPAHPGGRTRVLETVVGPYCHRQPGAGVPDSSGPGATAWPAGQTVGGVPAAGPPWLTKGRSGHTPPQEQTRGVGGLKKTPRSAGHPADSGCGQGTPRSVDVSR